MNRMRSLLHTSLIAGASMFAVDAFATDWLQWGFEPSHSANNDVEAAVTAANVSQLEQKYAVALTGRVNSAPVFAQGIVTASGTKDLLFVTAQSGRTTALNAADGSVVWSKTTTGGHTPIESSPAIDPDRQYVYSYGADGKAHKYAIGDGAEVTSGGWPQIVTLKPSVEKGASALAIATSAGTTRLYVVTNGYVGDGGDYQGHLVTIDLATGAQRIFNSMCSTNTSLIASGGCSDAQSGIWGRPGAVYDATTDRVYITTANGLFDANLGGHNWGDSVLALNPDGTGAGAGLPLDSHTPTNYAQLDGSDIDLGSASLSILPAPAASTVQHLGVQTGKDSKLHLINLDNMSGTGAPGGVGGEIEVIDVPISEFWMKTQSVVWVNSHGDGATWVYVGNGSGISGLKLTLTGANVPHLQPTWQQNSNATSAIIANDIVYHAGSCAAGTCILARNPTSGALLWTSPSIGSLKWSSPILVNGSLYIANYSSNSTLYRFALPAPTDIIFADDFEG